jgi:hypothetical protein
MDAYPFEAESKAYQKSSEFDIRNYSIAVTEILRIVKRKLEINSCPCVQLDTPFEVFSYDAKGYCARTNYYYHVLFNGPSDNPDFFTENPDYITLISQINVLFEPYGGCVDIRNVDDKTSIFFIKS